MSILPTFMEEQISAYQEASSVIEIPKEYEIDLNSGQLTGRIVEGTEALKVWIWLCLKTQRFRYPIFSWDYGIDIDQYIGEALSDEYLETDLRDEISDALCVNPYITGISNYVFERIGEKVRVSFSVDNTLGESIKEETNVSL